MLAAEEILRTNFVFYLAFHEFASSMIFNGGMFLRKSNKWEDIINFSIFCNFTVSGSPSTRHTEKFVVMS